MQLKLIISDSVEQYDFSLAPLSIFYQFDRIIHLATPDYGDDNMLQFNLTNPIAFLGVVPNFGRLILTLVFVGSFLLRPLWSIISTLWLRVIDSGKPIFTLLFSGVGVIVSIIKAILK
jgi:hypothetical protein